MKNQAQVIDDILTNSQTIAVVGISANPERPSNNVARYLQQQGFKIIPINPALDEVLGEPCYPSLSAAAKKHKIDLVNIFRQAKFVPGIFAEAINLGITNIWLQLGITNPEIAAIAAKENFNYVENNCIKVTHMAKQIGL